MLQPYETKVNMFLYLLCSLGLSVQYTDEESDVDSFQTQPWGLPVLQRSFTVSILAPQRKSVSQY